MWELDHKEGWIPKNWCFWAVVLVKTLESPMDCKEIQPVHPKGNQSWICIGRTDAEAEALILWPPDAKNWLIGKTLMLERIEGRRRRGQQDEMVGWHHWLNGRVWASSGSWWWTEKPGMLQSMESQRAGHGWVTGLNWTDVVRKFSIFILLHVGVQIAQHHLLTRISFLHCMFLPLLLKIRCA